MDYGPVRPTITIYLSNSHPSLLSALITHYVCWVFLLVSVVHPKGLQDANHKDEIY